MRFQDKKVVVTGGGGGMGQAICSGFAKEGADVAILDLVIEDAETAAKKVKDLGRKAIPMKVDVADFQAVNDCIDRVYREFKRIDILVNAAGVPQLVLFADMTEEMWDRCLAIHLKGVFTATRAVINGMISQRYGRIISISSIAGTFGVPMNSHYSAAKAGVIGLTRALAVEVAPLGITVNAIAPGATNTGFGKHASQEFLENIIKDIPVGRMARPEEMAALVLYLASDDAAYLTGEVININGGFRI